MNNAVEHRHKALLPEVTGIVGHTAQCRTHARKRSTHRFLIRTEHMIELRDRRKVDIIDLRKKEYRCRQRLRCLCTRKIGLRVVQKQLAHKHL